MFNIKCSTSTSVTVQTQFYVIFHIILPNIDILNAWLLCRLYGIWHYFMLKSSSNLKNVTFNQSVDFLPFFFFGATAHSGPCNTGTTARLLLSMSHPGWFFGVVRCQFSDSPSVVTQVSLTMIGTNIHADAGTRTQSLCDARRWRWQQQLWNALPNVLEKEKPYPVNGVSWTSIWHKS